MVNFTQCFINDYVFTYNDILEKRPQVTNWTNFDFDACLKLPDILKFKEAKWNVNDFTTTKNPIKHYYGPGVRLKL